MEEVKNFTALKTKPKKKLNKVFLALNIFLMLVVVGITGYYLRERLLTKKEKAYSPYSPFPIAKCSELSARDCGDYCSPVKSNGLNYYCKWTGQHGCIESSTPCGSDGRGSAVTCDSVTGPTPNGFPDKCPWEGDCCVPAGTSTGAKDCQGVGPRWTYCEKGYVCVQGRGCFPPTSPPGQPTLTPTKTRTPTPTKTPKPTKT
ncbi:hypothetical protein B6D29_02505, partial [Microgenomates bacterium UTCPR1]